MPARGRDASKPLDTGWQPSLQAVPSAVAKQGRMIFFSIGLPSRFTQLCDALIVRLAEHCLGSVELGSFNSFDDVATAAIRSSAAHFVAVSRQPVVRLQSELVASGRPFVVALGDIRSALHDLMQRPGYDVAAATRELASSCAAMLTLTQAPGALLLPGVHGHDPRRLAAAIAGHFGFPIGGDEIASIAASVSDEWADPGEDHANTDRLAPGEQAIVNGALQPYVHYFAGGDLESVVWEPDLFYVADDRPDAPRRPAIGPIDLTGRARFLVFGPYINLPPGPWSATIVAAFSAEAAGYSFIVEVAAGTQLAYERVQPTGEQVIETNLQFAIGNSVDQPVEIRIVIERAAFDGRMALGYVSLVPRAGVRIETQQQLIETLHR
jgi:hypothetical protein